MKKIQLLNQKEDIQISGALKEIEINTIDLLKVSINTPIEGGYSVGDLMTRIKLLDKVNEAEKTKKESISFEDAEFNELSKIVKLTKWNILSKKLLEFLQLFN